MGTEATATKSVLEQILDWSVARPLWLRDLLRRVVQQQTLSEQDHAEILQLCLVESKLEAPTATTPVAIPFDAMHIPKEAAAAKTVALDSVSDVAGVNQLAPSQQVTFEPVGVTVIYGDNGSGKSGYARILKRACRSRSRGVPIERNVYDLAAPTTPTAQIAYVTDGTRHSVTWTDSRSTSSAIPDLMSISVFDEECASVHLNNENEVAFSPFGLDVPQKLATACQKLKVSLQAKRVPFESRSSFLDRPTWSNTTKVGLALARLSAETDVEELKSLATLNATEASRTAELEKMLANNPAEAAKSLRVLAGRLKSVLQVVVNSTQAVSPTAVQNITDLRGTARTTRAAAELAASKLFSGDKLPGIGSEEWKQLWESARRYSESLAYAGRTFPVVDADAKCPLCHQTLADPSTFTTFETFVKADIGQKADLDKRAFVASVKTMNDARIRPSDCREQLTDLKNRNPALARSIREFLLKNALIRRRVALAIAANGELPSVTTGPSPADDLRREITAVEENANKCDAVSKDGARKLLEDELRELADRKTLSTLMPDVLKEVVRLVRVKCFDATILEANTTPITTLGNELAEATLTPQLRDRFAKELGLLASTRVRAELKKTRGERGKPMYRVQLIAAPNAELGRVLSEGEKKCVAIAGFLAEQATASHTSGLVFDDPVCSLDHRWRLKVAQRLVQAGKERQVIVFTHDIVLVHDLIDAAKTETVTCKPLWLRRDSAGTGIVEEGLPWIGSKIEDRIDKLQKQARDAKTLFDAGNEEDYGREVESIYSRLRAAWERCLEEVAFQRIVVRHRDYIDTKELKKVSVLTMQDCDDFRTNFKKCCDITDSHDASAGRNPEHPPPADVLSHIDSLATWTKSLRDRHKQVT